MASTSEIVHPLDLCSLTLQFQQPRRQRGDFDLQRYPLAVWLGQDGSVVHFVRRRRVAAFPQHRYDDLVVSRDLVEGETGPGQIVTWGKSTACSVDAFGFKFRWTTNSSKHIPFDWAGP